MKTHDTPEWRLKAFLQWVPINKTITCDHCNGTGQVGGGFKDIDGPRECPSCLGHKFITKQPETPEPEIPEKLKSALYKAWVKYHEKL